MQPATWAFTKVKTEVTEQDIKKELISPYFRLTVNIFVLIKVPTEELKFIANETLNTCTADS